MMSNRDEIHYRRLSNSSDDCDSPPEPMLEFAGGRRGAGERIPLIERSAFARYGPSTPVASGGSSDSTLLRARGGAASPGQPPKPYDGQMYFERDINPGETLTSISVQYSCPVSVLKQVNHLVADQEFFGLKVIRVPFRKYGLLSELLALESAENKLRAVNGGNGGNPSQPASVHDSRSCNGIRAEPTTCQLPQQPPLRHVLVDGRSDAVAVEPTSLSSCSDPSDYECDTSATDLVRMHASYDPAADDRRRRVAGCDGGTRSEGAFSEFLKTKDNELRRIAERVDSAERAWTANAAAALMRASPTFPLQIHRTRRNSGSWSNGVRVFIAFAVGLVVLIVLVLVYSLSRRA